jgi:hypothetical protein
MNRGIGKIMVGKIIKTNRWMLFPMILPLPFRVLPFLSSVSRRYR